MEYKCIYRVKFDLVEGNTADIVAAEIRKTTLALTSMLQLVSHTKIIDQRLSTGFVVFEVLNEPMEDQSVYVSWKMVISAILSALHVRFETLEMTKPGFFAFEFDSEQEEDDFYVDD